MRDTSAMGALRQVRERFLSGDAIEVAGDRPGTTTAITPRADIATSWRRSQAVGLAPDRIEVPYTPPPKMPRRLLAAATPIVDRLAVDLDETSGTILLADSEVRIIERRVGRRSSLSKLDGLYIAPGFVFAEEFVGTNGLGCALEEGRQFEVRGAEHFRDSLQALTCIAEPIRHPIRRTIIGALNVTCAPGEYSPFARVIMHRAVADIEHRLLESALEHERMVLDEFIARSRRSSDPAIAVADDVFICNPAADALLGQADRNMLRRWAMTALASARYDEELLELSDGTPIRAVATLIGDRPAPRGAVISIRQVAPRYDVAVTSPKPRPADTNDPNGIDNAVCGHSQAAAGLRSAAGRAAASGKPFIVTGEEGSGRRHIAYAVLRLREPSKVPMTADLAVDTSWLNDARTALADGTPVLLRNVQLAASDDSAAGVRGLVEYAAATGGALAATSTGLSVALAGIFPIGIAVPPLRERGADIRDLSAALLTKLADRDTPRALHPSTVRALQGLDWPGNVRELQLVLSLASQVCIGAEIWPRHLPVEYRSDNDGLTPIDRVERGMIVQALRDAGGNKLAAAAALGFARSTLYRKLRALRIDAD